MKLLVAFLLSFICVTLSTETIRTKHFTQEQVDAFNNWKITHNKVYSSSGEESARFAIFLESVKRVETRNQKAAAPVFGLTKFSDLTTEEFKSTYLGYVPRDPSQRVTFQTLLTGEPRAKSLPSKIKVNVEAAGPSLLLRMLNLCG